MRVRVDILNVSKLNMGMLLIERRPFLVTEQLSDVLRVFSVYVPPPPTLEYTTDDSVSRSECGEKDIALSLKVDESVVALKAQCIVADSSRLLQIIINCKLVSPPPVLPLTVCPQSSQMIQLIPGLALQQHSRLHHPFARRARTTRSHR